MATKTPVTYEDMLKDIYYKQGKPYGRNALFNEAKKQFGKKAPTEDFVTEWLKNQEIQQLYSATRKGGSVDRFIATRPWQEVSADLIDFTNRPARQYRYILVLIDNFSRYMYALPITSKKSKPTKTNPKSEEFAPSSAVAKAMEKVLDSIKTDFNAKPRVVMVDDGSEFKAEVIKLLDKRSIRKRRTLGGAPESNGLVERSNGKLKMLLKKNKLIHGGTWVDQLQRSVDAYNEHPIRTIKASPNIAVKYTTREQQNMLRANVEASRKPITPQTRQEKTFVVGDFVRVKLAKGKLSKMSDQSWSTQIYKIGKVIPARGTTATKYKIEGRAQDQSYSRNDLLKIDPDLVEPIPIRATRPREIIQNGKPVEVLPRERSKRGRVAKITEMPNWSKGKTIFAKYPVEGSTPKRKVYEWYEAKVVKRSDSIIEVQFTLDKIKKKYTLNDYRNGMLSESMPEEAPAVNKTPAPPETIRGRSRETPQQQPTQRELTPERVKQTRQPSNTKRRLAF